MDEPGPTRSPLTEGAAAPSDVASAAPALVASIRTIWASPLARALECGLLYGVVPALIDHYGLKRSLIPMLIGFAAYVLLMLQLDPGFERRRLWNFAGLVAHWRRVLLIFVAGAAAIAIFTILLVPDRLFSFPSRAPALYAMVMVLYPVFSVFPQELMFRTYFFQRFAPLFPNPWVMICASALAFGWAHIILGNWIAVVLSAIGGALFAYTYHHTRSTLAASIEHALYGDFIWTIGLGAFFYAGATAT